MSDPRDALAQLAGILPDYLDQTGARRVLEPATRDALLAAMGLPTDLDGAADALASREAEAAGRRLPPWIVHEAATALTLAPLEDAAWLWTPEDGAPSEGAGASLGDVPLGIHRLDTGGHVTWVLSAPAALPEPPRAWGVTLPLYGLDPDGGIGTYDQLAAAARSLGAAGADFVGINPVHAGFPADPTAVSPYSPTHRGRLATIHLAAGTPATGDLIDYEAAIPAQQAALRARFAEAGGPDAPDDPDLRRFAIHQALSDRFGPYWPDWPMAYRDPTSAEVARFADENADAIAFHVWAQEEAAGALRAVQDAALAAGMRFGLYLDLAVGTHPAGAETWGQPDLFARGVSLGAPPDAFSADGQSWGLAPLRPDTLAAEGFRPLAAILRRQFAVAKLLRIDHILGFERAFWVPGADGVAGAYVDMPKAAMLAVARIEAGRAGATIVGEDLGNIPKGLQEDLAASGILGCRVAQFQQDWKADAPTFLPADDYARGALTSFGTHDLPTWNGWRQGRDIDWRHRLGSIDADTRDRIRRHRRAEAQALTDRVGGTRADDLHGFLARTPSRLVAVQIEDILGAEEQPNLPGTVHEHPNWRRPLGVAPETLGQLDALKRTAAIMTRAGRHR